jgi:hypothetical protein
MPGDEPGEAIKLIDGLVVEQAEDAQSFQSTVFIPRQGGQSCGSPASDLASVIYKPEDVIHSRLLRSGGFALFLVLAHPHVVATHPVGDEQAGQQHHQQHQALFLLVDLEMGILCGQQFLLFQGDPQIAQGQVSVLDLLDELDAPLALLRQGFVVAADGQQAVQRQGVVRLGEGMPRAS